MSSVRESWRGNPKPEPQVGQPPQDHQRGWWFAECPQHGRTPHLAIFGGFCERCAGERELVLSMKRTRQ
jgi:hypothetical protein